MLFLECEVTTQVQTGNLIHHSKMKHGELDLCFVREKVQTGQVLVNFVPASDQLTDITKSITEK